MVWNGTVKLQPHSSLTTTVLGGTRYCWRSRVIARGSAGWLWNQIRVAPSLLSALLHLLVPHLGPGHLKLHKEWFQPPPQITPIISNGGWELVKGASGFHRSLGDPAQPAEFQFVRAPLHTHLHLLTTCPEGFSTRPWNHSPRSTSEPATTAGGCASLVRGWTPHAAKVCLVTSLVCGLCCAFSPLCLSTLIWSHRKSSSPTLLMKPSLTLNRCSISLLALKVSCLQWQFCISLSPRVNSLRAEMMFHSCLYPQSNDHSALCGNAVQ